MMQCKFGEENRISCTQESASAVAANNKSWSNEKEVESLHSDVAQTAFRPCGQQSRALRHCVEEQNRQFQKEVESLHSDVAQTALRPSGQQSRVLRHCVEEQNRQLQKEVESLHSDVAQTAFRPSGQQSRVRHCVEEQNRHLVGRNNSVDAEDFIMGHSLPAAQAMAAEVPSSVAASQTFGPDDSHRIPAAGRSILQVSTTPTVEVRVVNDVKGDVGKDNENLCSRSCCFPSKFRWPALRDSLVGFQASKSFQKHARSSHKLRFDQRSFNSDDLFWSDEECLKNEDSEKLHQIAPAPLKTDLDLEGFSTRKTAIESGAACSVKNSDRSNTEGFQESRVSCPRKHTMQTVHTPDHKGFLGIPRISGLSGDNGVKQVDRLGARLSHMISKSNYTEARRSQVGDNNGKEYECAQRHPACQAPPVTFSPLLKLPKMKPAGPPLLPALKPPPSPISPSESWLSTKSIPAVKKPSRKPLGSFIPIKTPIDARKSAESESCKDISRHGGRPPRYSLKGQLRDRQSISHTVQAI